MLFDGNTVGMANTVEMDHIQISLRTFGKGKIKSHGQEVHCANNIVRLWKDTSCHIKAAQSQRVLRIDDCPRR